MFIRPDKKTAYQVVVEPQMMEEIREAKERGLNLQPLIREFIKACIEKNKTQYSQEARA